MTYLYIIVFTALVLLAIYSFAFLRQVLKNGFFFLPKTANIQ
jgi:hypothetical protein